MSEIPKLMYYVGNIVNNINDTKSHYSIWIDDINLKEVNDFWYKYKNRPMSFLEDYPEYNEEVNDLLKYYEFLSDKYKLIFRNWLHDLLYKVE